MSQDDIRRMVEEATKEAMKRSFTEAGKKFLDAARVSEQKGDYGNVENLQRQAAENFTKAAEEYRAAKSYKAASLNMCMAGDVYSELADAANALKAYEQGANDLFGASTEHLMWNEDAETKKGTALAVAGSMILLMIGKEDEAFTRARRFASDNASKLRFPGVVRLSQIPQMIESAINSMDLNAFADAETAAVTELKASLASAKAQEFVPYVDKGIEMVREILRGKLKVPKISSQLDLPVDMTFKEEFEIRAIVENNGDGPANDVKIEWHIDEGIKILSGEIKQTVGQIPAGETRFFVLVAKSAQDHMGVKEFSVVLRGSYFDDLRTEYSLQAGPGTFVLKDFKETEKLLQDVDVSEGRVSILYPSIDSSKFESEPIMHIVSSLESALKLARTEIAQKELSAAKARIAIVNSLVDAVDKILGDEEMQAKIEKTRLEQKKEYAKEQLSTLRSDILRKFDEYQQRVRAENDTLLAAWDSKAAEKKKAQDEVAGVKSKISSLVAEVSSAYDSIPMASASDSQEIAEARTKARTALEKVKSTLSSIASDVDSIGSMNALASESRPAEHPAIAKVMAILEEMKRDLSSAIDSKLGGT